MDADWECHKVILRKLYFDEDSKNRKVGTLSHIMKYMEKAHSFVMSKGQYERQFKKWGFRKNCTATDWKIIHDRIEKRKLQGKASDVYKSGKLVQAAKLSKEKRHHFRKADELYNSEESPQTPEGFVVCTPKSNDTIPVSVSIDNLPSLQFVRDLVTLVSARPDALHNLFTHQQPSQTHAESPAVSAQPANMEIAVQLPSSIGRNSTARAPGSITASAIALETRVHDSYRNLDLSLQQILAIKPKDVFQISRTGELSSDLFLMLHLITNNLLDGRNASAYLEPFLQGRYRGLFDIVISMRSPATQGIARLLLPSAIGSSDVEMVRSLLNTGIDPDSAVGYDHETPLYLAIAKGSMELSQLLLDSGAHVNMSSPLYGGRLLATAAESGRSDLVRLLLVAGANVNARDHRGRTAIQVAASTGAADLMQLLLGAKASLSGRSGAEALREAVHRGDLELVRTLLSLGATVDVSRSRYTGSATALHTAVARGDTTMAQILLAHGANVNAYETIEGRTALQLAVHTRDITLVRLLLSHGADINALADRYGKTALQAAVETGDIVLVQDLLSHGADVNFSDYCGETILSKAASGGNLDMVCLLLTFGASGAVAASRAASSKGHTDIVQYLKHVGLGSTSSVVSASKRILASDLLSAVSSGDYDLVGYLLDLGLDVNMPIVTCDRARGVLSHMGVKTLLQVAAGRLDCDLVQLLITYGADVNAPAAGSCGLTALETAVRKGSTKLVRLLVNAGANVNAAASNNQMMVLGLAASHGNLEMVRLLLDSGADVLKQGEEALGAAIGFQNSSGIVALISLKWTSSAIARIDGKIDHPRLPAFELVKQDDVELTRLVLDIGALDKTHALQCAAGENNLSLVELLLEYGADVNDCVPEVCKRHALQEAATFNNLEMIKVLIEHGANAEEKARALQAASSYGCTEAARLLIDFGADISSDPIVDLKDVGWRTTLQGAAGSGNLELVRLLLEKSVEVQRPSPTEHEQGTALQLGAIAGSVSIVVELLQHNANVNAPSIGPHGRTALEGAAEHGRLDVVQLLINQGAGVLGSRALAFARTEGHDGVVQLLLDHGFEDKLDLVQCQTNPKLSCLAETSRGCSEFARDFVAL